MDRREFLKGSAVAAAFAGAPAILRADGAKRTFKVGLVGCGGRGNGAMENIVKAWLDEKLNIKAEECAALIAKTYLRSKPEALAKLEAAAE